MQVYDFFKILVDAIKAGHGNREIVIESQEIESLNLFIVGDDDLAFMEILLKSPVNQQTLDAVSKTLAEEIPHIPTELL